MSNEDIQKIMNFPIQRQEVFAENLERVEGVVATLVESHIKLVEAQTQAQRDIATLAQVLTRLAKEKGE
jgi:hypothetical protein